MNLGCIKRSTATINILNYNWRGINYVYCCFSSKATYGTLSLIKKVSVYLELGPKNLYRSSGCNISTFVAKSKTCTDIYPDMKYPLAIPFRKLCSKKTTYSNPENIQKNSMDEQTKNMEQIVNAKEVKNSEESTLTKAQKLKKAFAQYGTTAVVFHVGISLISLGVCYLTVTSFSGVDYQQIYEYLGIHENKLAQNAGVFVTAYAIHKVMAPLRISITLGAVPFVVKYLRRKGLIKK